MPRPTRHRGLALNELDGLGLEVEAVAALDEVAKAGPRKMIDKRAHALSRQHVHGSEAGLDAERPVGVESILHPWILDDDIVVRQIAREIEGV